MTYYGLKAHFPVTWLVDGPFLLETNLLYTSVVPDYYNDMATESPSGFLLLFDILGLFPILEPGNNSMIYLGAGPLVSASKIQAKMVGRDWDLEEWKFGLSCSLGLALRLNPIAFRLEGKYYLEKASLFGGLASIQIVF